RIDNSLCDVRRQPLAALALGRARVRGEAQPVEMAVAVEARVMERLGLSLLLLGRVLQPIDHRADGGGALVRRRLPPGGVAGRAGGWSAEVGHQLSADP